MSVFSRKGAKRVRTIADGEIKRLVGLPETKFIDGVTAVTTAPHTTGAVWVANQVAQGLTSSTRLGDQVKSRRVLYRLSFYNSVNNTAPVPVRVIVGIDWESKGAVPQLSDILQTPAGPHLSHLNLSTTRGRFKILRDKTILLGPATVVASIPAGTIQMNATTASVKNMRLFIPLRHMIQYNGTTATDYSIGSIFLAVAGSTTGANSIGVEFISRFRWTDV